MSEDDIITGLQNLTVNTLKKGSNASKEGSKYEQIVHNIVINCKINNKIFNTQTVNKLGGSSPRNDLQCNFEKEEDIGIEIKKLKTPDWMQCVIKFEDGKWVGSKRKVIPEESQKIFIDLIKDKNLFKGKNPLLKNITYDEWKNIKNDFKDEYFDCPSDTIKKLYSFKECSYIQISDKGLYHLGNDICNFGVSEYSCDQKLRVRVKIHTKKDKNGFCKMSVVVSCMPKDISQIEKSKYSLDDKIRLPSNLIYLNVV